MRYIEHCYMFSRFLCVKCEIPLSGVEQRIWFWICYIRGNAEPSTKFKRIFRIEKKSHSA